MDYPGIICGLCEVHKDIFDNCPPFQPILSAINTPTYKLAKLLVPISKSLTSNEDKGKDYLPFAKEIVEQDSDFFYGKPGHLLILFLLTSHLKRIHFVEILNKEKVYQK